MTTNPKKQRNLTTRPNSIPNNSSAQVSAATLSQWSSPLPPPEVLEEYNRVSPEFSDTIVRMVQLEQTHRHSMDSSRMAALTSNLISSSRQDLIGFVFLWFLLGACIVGAFFAMFLGDWKMLALWLSGAFLKGLGLFLNYLRKPPSLNETPPTSLASKDSPREGS